MEFIEKFRSALSNYGLFDEIYSLVPAALWKTNPRKAGVIALKRVDCFDGEAYLKNYKDVRDTKIDALEHWVMNGIDECRTFFSNKNISHSSKKKFHNKINNNNYLDYTDINCVKMQEDENYKKTNTLNIPKVSVLIPVYNNYQYIQKCLTSVINQQLKEIEIIIINDGSTDERVVEYIDSFSKKDSRVVLINKENTGYGDSMNCGLRKSRGEYIGIVESDDYIELDMYKNLYNLAISYNVNIVRSGYYSFSQNTKKKINLLNKYELYYKKINPKDHHEIFLLSPAIWSCIYKREFLNSNSIIFNNTPGASFQDTSFNLITLLKSDNILLDYNCYYNYRADNELSSVKSGSKALCIKDEFDYIAKYITKNKLDGFIVDSIVKYDKYIRYKWNYNRLNRKKQFFKYYKNSIIEVLSNKYLNINEIKVIDKFIYKNAIKPFITIIIPTFNVEKYISKCIDSVLNQNIDNYEIIIIDDCSTDNTYQIIKKYAAIYKKITAIKLNKNYGQGYARNIAINRSKGVYLMFVDGDDWIESNSLLDLYLKSVNQNSEMTFYSGYNIQENGSKLINRSWSYNYIFNKSKVYSYLDLLNNIWTLPVSTCLILYKKSFIIKNNIKFIEGRIFEDNYFFTQSILNANNIYFYDKKIYYRLLRSNSTTHRTDDKLIDCIYVYDECYNYIKSKNIDDIIKFNYIATRFNYLEYLFKIVKNKKKFYIHLRNFILKNVDANNLINVKNYKFCKNVYESETYEKFKRISK
ncbi:MAG: glycosyltransferase family 2 protein [Clostridia bacterium]|nr:glycosyltransferase family 2 protein [Clostridia bacterium]